MIIMAISFSQQGAATGRKLENSLKGGGSQQACLHFQWQEPGERAEDFVARAFYYHLPLLVIGALGICVRLISPHVHDKTTDSPVLCMDDLGHFVIPVLSGHLGGANDLAGIIAAALHAVPVITTGSDVHGTFAADVFARRNGLCIRNREGVSAVARKAVAGNTVTIFIDPQIQICAEPFCQSGCSKMEQPEPGEACGKVEQLELGKACSKEEQSESEEVDGQHVPVAVRLTGKLPADILVSCSEIIENTEVSAEDYLLWLSPRTSVIGMGCRRGKTFEELNDFLLEMLAAHHPGDVYFGDSSDEEGQVEARGRSGKEHQGKILAGDPETWLREHVRAIATIDRKADEPGLEMLAQFWHLPLLTYSAQELEATPGRFSSSDFVRQTTGTSNVCERAAVRAAGEYGKSRLLIPKVARDGMTLAMAEGAPGIRTFDTGVAQECMKGRA